MKATVWSLKVDSMVSSPFVTQPCASGESNKRHQAALAFGKKFGTNSEKGTLLKTQR